MSLMVIEGHPLTEGDADGVQPFIMTSEKVWREDGRYLIYYIFKRAPETLVVEGQRADPKSV